MFRCLIFLIFLFGILPVLCQEPEYIHFTVEDGLPSSQVYDIIQDAEGYMWFATDNGVCRYDGSEFIIYTTDDGLPANIVFEIYPDQQGRIWFIGPGCLLSFYEKGHVTPFAFNKEILREFKGGILPIKKTFRIDESGKIFLSIMGKGNMIVYPDGKIIGNFPGGSTKITVLKDTITILSPCEFNDGKIYADYFGERDTIIYPRLEKSFSNEVFFDFYGKGMLVTMNNRILFYRGKSDYDFREFHKRIIYYLKTGNEIWLGFLHGGAVCYNNATFSSVPDMFLEDKSISSIFRDKENGYWFASLNDGVFYSPTLHVKSFKNNGVGDLAVMDNSLIFCDLPDKIYRLKKNPEPLLSFPGNVIGPVYYNHADASLYIGTGDMLAIYKDRQTRIIKNFYFETDGLLHKMVIRHISGLNNGKVLLSTYSRYYVFDGKTLGIMKIPIADENLHDLTIHEGRDGVHWIGAKTGLYSRKGETDYFYGKEYPVLSHAINTITDFKNGLLIGTEDTGLVFFDGKTCRTTSRINGITDNAVTCIAIDRQERIWAGTKNGLNRINWDVNELDNPDVFRITRMHGLVSGEINDLVIINDTLYVSTGSGLSIFSIHDLHPDTVSSPPLIKAIRIADKDTVISNFYILNYNQNFINIQYTGLDFNKQTTRLFKYRLIRYNTPTQWEYTTSSYARF
ncbi:MAG: two-component regulator propeller domain-containing protein, partial [Bacteroidota bacterium]